MEASKKGTAACLGCITQNPHPGLTFEGLDILGGTNPLSSIYSPPGRPPGTLSPKHFRNVVYKEMGRRFLFHMSSVFLAKDLVRLYSLYKILYQKEDIILLYIGYHSTPKLNTTHMRGKGILVGLLEFLLQGPRLMITASAFPLFHLVCKTDPETLNPNIPNYTLTAAQVCLSHSQYFQCKECKIHWKTHGT